MNNNVVRVLTAKCAATVLCTDFILVKLEFLRNKTLRVGVDYQYGTCRFSVWAPNRSQVTLHFPDENQWFELEKAGGGYWTHTVEGLEPNTQYMYRLDGKEDKPDPASHYQPNGVFGPSAVIDHESYDWKDHNWGGLDIKDIVFYELHVGAFTPEGTFNAAQKRVAELSDLGVNALELMPITQFSGTRNWGYDGVFPFAVQNSYGHPDNLKALVDECHRYGVALFVDFVYNHLGPEGSCLNDYAPYFPSLKTGRWGAAVNLDGENSDGVRNYFLENTLHWFSHYHIDGIRLDAVLSMQDSGPKHFLQELNENLYRFSEQTGRKCYLIAETGYNVPKVLVPTSEGGFGFDAQWLDDYQHALFALLTGEKEGYYREYQGIQDVLEVLNQGYVYVGDESEYKRRGPEESYRWISADKFVVFSQNHDQVGNRLLGDRLTAISGFEASKLAAGIVLLSPYVPLLFMGEEYGETAPFLFFIDYQSKQLRDSVRDGRRKEFAHFNWKGEAADPQKVETFEESKLNWSRRHEARGEKIAAYYHDLITLKRQNPLFMAETDRNIKSLASPDGKILLVNKEKRSSRRCYHGQLFKHARNTVFSL